MTGHDHDHGAHPSGHDEGHGHSRDNHEAHEHGHAHGHGHGHTQGHTHGAGRAALAFVLALTLGFCAIEAAAGFFVGSLALLSDAAHMLTDAFGLGIAFIAMTLGTKKKSGRSTFGLRRLPVLGGLVNAVLVMGAAWMILLEALDRIATPRAIDGGPVVIVGVVGLIVNLIGAWIMHRSGDKSVNMRGAMLHLVGDALGSVAAIVAGAVVMFTGLFVVDAIASVLVAGIITVGAVRLIIDVGSILLERAPAHFDVAQVEAVLTSTPGVDRVVGLHAWELD